MHNWNVSIMPLNQCHADIQGFVSDVLCIDGLYLKRYITHMFFCLFNISSSTSFALMAHQLNCVQSIICVFNVSSMMYG